MHYRDAEEIWDFLNEHGIVKIGYLKVHKSGFFSIKQGRNDNEHKFYGRFEDFNLNLFRIMLLFEDLKKISSNDEKSVNIKFQIYGEIIIILLMGALEAFFRDTFVAIISNVKIYKKKLKEDKELIDLLEKIKKNNPIFQEKDSLKKAYSCIDIDLIYLIENEVWKRIFSGSELDSKTKFMGYMKMRHDFIHNGFTSTLYNQRILNEKFISIAILDVVKVVYIIQTKIPDYTVTLEFNSSELFKKGR